MKRLFAIVMALALIATAFFVNTLNQTRRNLEMTETELSRQYQVNMDVLLSYFRDAQFDLDLLDANPRAQSVLLNALQGRYGALTEPRNALVFTKLLRLEAPELSAQLIAEHLPEIAEHQNQYSLRQSRLSCMLGSYQQHRSSLLSQLVGAPTAKLFVVTEAVNFINGASADIVKGIFAETIMFNSVAMNSAGLSCDG